MPHITASLNGRVIYPKNSPTDKVFYKVYKSMDKELTRHTWNYVGRGYNLEEKYGRVNEVLIRHTDLITMLNQELNSVQGLV